MARQVVMIMALVLIGATTVHKGSWVKSSGEVISVPCPSIASEDSRGTKVPETCAAPEPMVCLTVAQFVESQGALSEMRSELEYLRRENQALRALSSGGIDSLESCERSGLQRSLIIGAASCALCGGASLTFKW